MKFSTLAFAAVVVSSTAAAVDKERKIRGQIRNTTRRLAPPCGTPKGGPCSSTSLPSFSLSPSPSSSSTPSPSSDMKPKCSSVDECLSKMSLAQKVGQMTQIEKGSLASDDDIATYHLGSLLSGGGGAPESGNFAEDWADMIDRFQKAALSSDLGIPLLYGVDAVHGHSNVFGATIFPHNIGLGATRNASLAEEIGRITAIETRATGIPWTFAPCLCVTRDERWGRSFECFGETAQLVTSMVTVIDGLQGPVSEGAERLKKLERVLATAKHWIADGGTLGGDDQGDAVMDEAELRSVHMPPYVDAIAREVGSIMPSYSSWNGTKMHGSDYLINNVLKGELNFTGFVVSDWKAIDQLVGDYNSDVRTSINAGNDLIMVPYDYKLFKSTLTEEINTGNINMSRINDAVSKILEAKFALGLFDPPYGLSNRTNINDIGSPAHRQVARQAVRESLVLLKNNNSTLPFSKDIQKVVIAGKSANDIGNQCGGWTITWQGASGDTTPGTTVYEGVRELLNVSIEVELESNPTKRVSGDIGIVVVGEQPYAEGAGDDQHLGLDSRDDRVIMNVCRNMPCVVVLISGRPMLIEKYINAKEVDAFVAAWLPGTEGNGISDVLFGDYDFTGKLPVTWPRTMDQIPVNFDDVGYNTIDVLFRYGYGMTPF